MPRYAVKTTVTVEKSRDEIERILKRYGATQFAYGWQENKAVIQFRANDRQVRFELPLPLEHSARSKATWEQVCRQRWRALVLCIKAKLEAVESKISEFEDEFMAHIVLPSNETVGQWLRPQIEEAYQTRQMPQMLLALPAPQSQE